MVDYSQTAEDHQSFLVLVRHTGSHITGKTFHRAWERIKLLNSVAIPGQKRVVWVRYKRSYPKETNEWGDFQAHRKTLGLISVGKCSNIKEFEELFENYKTIKEEYANTLFNSRLIVFGMNKDGSPLSEQQKRRWYAPDSELSSSSSSPDSPTEPNTSNTIQDDPLGSNCQNDTDSGIMSEGGEETSTAEEEGASSVTAGRRHSNSLTKDSSGAEVVFYPCLEQSFDLEERLKEFIMSLFFVLEGKRLDRSFERLDRMQLLCAPFEKKDYVGVDTDTK